MDRLDPWALVVDPGIDDAVALAVLAGSGAQPDLVVAVPGNVDGSTSSANAGGLLEALGWEVMFRCFEGRPPPPMPGRSTVHGDDGLGGLADRLRPSPPPDPLAVADWPATVLATGPLSVVAASIVAGCPFDRIMWMGGALDGGNVTSAAEFNAWCDPGAVNTVVAAGPEVAIVPLDLTRTVVLDAPALAAWDAGGPVAALLAAAVRTRPVPVAHDAVAAVAWLHPELFCWEHHSVRALTAGEERGRIVVGPTGPTAVAVDADRDAVRERIVGSVLRAPSGGLRRPRG